MLQYVIINPRKGTNMLIKNNSARGYFIAGTIIAPLETKEVDCKDADIEGLTDLEIVKPKQEVKGK